MRAASFSGALLTRESSTPLYRQLYELLRGEILSGRLASGQRLASTRTLADDLGVSRNTAMEAIELLVAEGYLIGRVGAGTFVAEDLPEVPLRPLEEDGRAREDALPRLSRRGERLAEVPPRDLVLDRRPFRSVSELREFPWSTWRRLAARRAGECEKILRAGVDARGYLPLREKVARRLWETRGVSCTPEQIFLVRGSHQALQLAAHVLLDTDDAVWVEDPCYPGARRVLEFAGARLVPVSVDQEGLSVDDGLLRAPSARAAYVTPSHQYPLGMTMTVKRRLELLSWARDAGSWIIEDDYDGGYRYDGRPLASLASVDNGRHVIYVGTFSRVFFPALRLGYLVVPPAHIAAFQNARDRLDPGSFNLEHLIVDELLAEGHADSHIRRMRTLYKRRQQSLIEALVEHLGDEIEARPRPAGLNLIGWLGNDYGEDEVARRAAGAGLHVEGVASYVLSHSLAPGLVLGFGAFSEEEIVGGVLKLKEVLRSIRRDQEVSATS